MKKTATKSANKTTTKDAELDPFRAQPAGQFLTTDQGLRVEHTDDSLKAGVRGPTLFEDHHLREKITHFDHERIPERVVHARGSAAHGYFQVYQSMSKLTRAGFLTDPNKKTPVFVRFSTVGGSRGSADTVRDVRGFATKFYTDEGNFDLVGNNMPVFFIQDGIKFPDFVHAVKPEPKHEMPQASSAHDSLWDFVSLVPETAHMIMWLMSDRALPRSYSMMEGFGVHTFRLVNAQGKSSLVKFHWKPLKGAHSLAWDECQKLAGKDPDFNRRDLWESIERGDYPEWELGVQVMGEDEQLSHGFDLLDPTKLVPEELVPVRRIGKMTLNRNPDNFFAETEQVAFCVSNLVPGIGVTNDPLMQARLFSYVDTQISRLGGPNFAEIPINRPVAPVHNHQQDGMHRQTINVAQANYHPNSTGGGCPFLAGMKDGGYTHFPEPLEGVKINRRAESFTDHFSQATLFLLSQSSAERKHLTDALKFELAKVDREEIRQRVLDEILANIDGELAAEVADALGLSVKKKSKKPRGKITKSPALSLDNQPRTAEGRVVAILAADGVSGGEIARVRGACESAGARVEVLSPKLGTVRSSDKSSVKVDKRLLTAPSVAYDAVFLPGGERSISALAADGDARHFVSEAFKHCKAIGASGEGARLLAVANIPPDADGVIVDQGAKTFARSFVEALAQHRFWNRDIEAVSA